MTDDTAWDHDGLAFLRTGEGPATLSDLPALPELPPGPADLPAAVMPGVPYPEDLEFEITDARWRLLRAHAYTASHPWVPAHDADRRASVILAATPSAQWCESVLGMKPHPHELDLTPMTCRRCGDDGLAMVLGCWDATWPAPISPASATAASWPNRAQAGKGGPAPPTMARSSPAGSWRPRPEAATVSTYAQSVTAIIISLAAITLSLAAVWHVRRGLKRLRAREAAAAEQRANDTEPR